MKQYISNKNIILIGMSGVGKTTVGNYVSKKLNMRFIDTDNQIILNTGKAIEDIFNEYGEEYFRVLENQIINNVSIYKRTVISTGGGVVLDKVNIYSLKNNGIIFLLKASIDTIFNNLKSNQLSSDRRPLLKGESNLRNKIKELYKKREKLYLYNADYIIDVDNKSINEVGNEIIYIFNSLYSCS